MSLAEVGQYIYDNPALIAGIAAGIGLYFTAAALRHQQKQAQFKMAESVYRDLRELEKELSQIPPRDPTEHVDVKYNEAIRDWDSRFFNTLEWFSFLINVREIRNKKLVDYFKPSIIAWYEQIFLKNAGNEVVNDPNQYEELKKLYKKFKE